MSPRPAPKPAARPDRVSLWHYGRLFRRDILSAQPERLFAAKMAEFRTPFFRSFLLNEPDLVDTVLRDRARDFPKAGRIADGLRPLLGASVFLTNGETWARQRRIIDPAFEGGRIRATFPAMAAAAEAMAARLTPGIHDVEPVMSHVTADVIFRTLFSIPIEDATAMAVFDAFRRYQRAQPILNAGALLALPRWIPRGHRRQTRAAAREIRALIGDMTRARAAEIAAGTAPDDLATKIMTTPDPETGRRFTPAEMADQVAIFFLAGHETSASALAWALYLLACDPGAQDRAASEVVAMPDFSTVSAATFTRDVFREALRLYPAVPMMVRQATVPERFRDRPVPQGAHLVISPWHLHRNPRHWDDPDVFDPDRFGTEAGRAAMRRAYLPFSAGPRVCPGAGFAMTEAVLILMTILRDWRLSPVDGREPVPVAHLTLRSRDGIAVAFSPRHHDGGAE
ncbi:cytochrome P450 [Rhodobacterales bacterium HKCCE2091]|nr:cytochrome P450 [Rhodobacterales bacterium HKCCE2091]